MSRIRIGLVSGSLSPETPTYGHRENRCRANLSLSQIVNNLGQLSTKIKPTARHLGVFFDPDLNLKLHVKKVVLLLSFKKYS